MNRNAIIDKIFIFSLSFFLMMQRLSGKPLIIAAYLAVAFSAIGYWLLSHNPKEDAEDLQRRKRIASVLQDAVAITGIFYPPALTALPCVGYDMTRCRNYIGGVAGVMAAVNASWIGEPAMLWGGAIFLSLFAVYLSLGAEKAELLARDYHSLRDDSTEKRNRLQKQNMELERARDAEIYTAQLSERNRIAREIHDNVGHMLSRALLQMGALLSMHKEEPVHSQLTAVRETLDTAMTNIRSSVHDLHEESIDVEKNIREMAAPLSERFITEIEVDISETDMSRPVKYAILGITREAVSNIMKHSRGDHVKIQLIQHPALYQLIVHDWAEQDAPQRKDSERQGRNREKSGDGSGIGLENMRSRAESVGGTLHTSDENGFRVFAMIPIKTEN